MVFQKEQRVEKELHCPIMVALELPQVVGCVTLKGSVLLMTDEAIGSRDGVTTGGELD